MNKEDIIITNLEKISDKLSDVNVDVQNIKIIQMKHEENLRHHIARTEAAEKRLNIIEDNLIPIRNHVLIINTLVKIVIFLATTAVTIRKLFF